MKSKILYLIIGILIGAIITTSIFLIYNKVVVKNQTEQKTMQMDGKGQNGLRSNETMGEPPSMTNGGTPPERPLNANTNNV